jgi:HAD superfamily phosphoserine phosphatase-like hydrolase
MNSSTSLRIAFLDLDHTLLAADSNQLWMSYLLEHGLISDADLAVHEGYVDDYGHGRLDFADLLVFRNRIDGSIAPGMLSEHLERFAVAVLLPAIAADAPALVAGLHAEGLETLVVSASSETLVRPVAHALGITQVIGADSNPGLGWPCFGAGKVHHVEDWLARRGQSLAGLAESRFYSDSHNDLPLLESVDRPCAVDPDPVLARVAAARGWPVISLRREAVPA